MADSSSEKVVTHNANTRVEEAAKDRWHSIKRNPKIIFIALFAS